MSLLGSRQKKVVELLMHAIHFIVVFQENISKEPFYSCFMIFIDESNRPDNEICWTNLSNFAGTILAFRKILAFT